MGVMAQPTDAELQFIEDVGLFFEGLGLPRMSGRILGWLLICDPPEQTGPDMVEALQASKSSISTMSRLLVNLRLIERISLPGERRDFYRIRPDVWEQSMMDRQNHFRTMREIAERGMTLLEDAKPETRQRVTHMRDIFTFFEEEMPNLLSLWRASQK